MRNTTVLSEITAICPDPIIAVDSKGIISVFNPAAERLLGYQAADVVGAMHIRALYSSEADARAVMLTMLSGRLGAPGKLEGYETAILSCDGIRIPIRLSASLIMDGDQRGSIGFFHDLTQQKTLETNLKKQSITDDLSGLYNQRYFYSRLSKEMERAKRYAASASLICIDLDGFKQVNDRLGHLEGDQVIRRMGQLLLETIRDSDLAFRYGGDEFMVLLPNTDGDHGMNSAHRIRERFNASCFYSPEFAAEGDVCLSMSLGVASTDGNEPVDHLIQRADMAMYRAKHAGGNCAVPLQACADVKAPDAEAIA